MLQIPSTSEELFEEIGTFANSLDAPLNQLLLLEIYKLFVQHKLDFTYNQVINDFAALQQQEALHNQHNAQLAHKLKSRG